MRDETIFPNINRAGYAVTIYPPTAQAVFLAVTRFGESVVAMKLGLLTFDAAIIAALLALFRGQGSPTARIAAYAWHPLPIWEIAGHGHIDVAMCGLLMVGLLLFLHGRTLFAGVLVTLGALVKPTALLALPVFWRPWNWRLPLVVLSTAVLAYLPYLSVGRGVFGYLGGYVEEEGFSSGRGINLLWLMERVAGPDATGAPNLYCSRRNNFDRPRICRRFSQGSLGSDCHRVPLLAPRHLHDAHFPALSVVLPSSRPIPRYLPIGDGLGFDPRVSAALRGCRRRRMAGLRCPYRRVHAGNHRSARLRRMELATQTPQPDSRSHAMSMTARAIDPRRYHEAIEPGMSRVAASDPVCLYLETTNRCNLLCTTCPRTYADLEPQADMSWELFTRIVDQVPNIARVVLHGVGEPMLVKDLPRMIRYLKDRGAYVLFNTNGTVLTPKRGRELSESGLDELRVSLDAANARTFLQIRGKDYFNRIVRNVRTFIEMQAREGLDRPRVSLWLTGLKETIAQLPDFVRIARDIGVREVYLQRLVFSEDAPIGMAIPDQALFERLTQEEFAAFSRCRTASGRTRH